MRATTAATAAWRAGLLAVAPPAAAHVGAVPTVTIINGAQPGSLTVRATSPTRLAPALGVERQGADGTFAPVRQLDLGLRLVACGGPADGCVAVGPAGLRPAAWSGLSCSAQCPRDCDKNVRLHGRFRFVLWSCDHRTRYTGPIFRM